MMTHKAAGATKCPRMKTGACTLTGRSVHTLWMYDAARILCTIASGRRYFGMKRMVSGQKCSGTGCGLGLIQEICARLHQEA